MRPKSPNPRIPVGRRPARSPPKPPNDPVDDTPEYVANWAAGLARALTRGELAHLAAMYGRNARNARLGAGDRSHARRRELAIRKRTRRK
jgi:hypothetical protein